MVSSWSAQKLRQWMQLKSEYSMTLTGALGSPTDRPSMLTRSRVSGTFTFSALTGRLGIMSSAARPRAATVAIAIQIMRFRRSWAFRCARNASRRLIFFSVDLPFLAIHFLLDCMLINNPLAEHTFIRPIFCHNHPQLSISNVKNILMPAVIQIDRKLIAGQAETNALIERQRGFVGVLGVDRDLP